MPAPSYPAYLYCRCIAVGGGGYATKRRLNMTNETKEKWITGVLKMGMGMGMGIGIVWVGKVVCSGV